MATKAKKRQRSESRHAARQERKKQTAAANPPPKPGGELLCHQPTIAADTQLIAKAIRNEWPVTPEIMQSSVERLDQIQKKKTVLVPCGDGTFPSEAVADANAVRAISLLKAMVTANLKSESGGKGQPQTTINVGVNVDARTDERRTRTLAIAERIRAGGVLVDDSD